MLRASFFVLAMTAALAAAMDFRLYGVNYNSRQGADWDPKKCKSQPQVDADMAKVKTIADRVRIYSLVDCEQGAMTLAGAKKAGLKVWLGMWVTDQATFDSEFAALKALVAGGRIDSSVVGIHVGSENLYRKDLSAEQAISFVKTVKTYLTSQSVSIPVSVADIVDAFVQYPTVLDAVDVIQANSFPFWEPALIETAMINFKIKMDKLKPLAKGKEIQISETGWASGGTNSNASEASPANHAKYLLDFYNYATNNNLKFYYFAAFDDEWKGHVPGQEKDVESHFGLFDGKGVLKPKIAELVWTNSSINPDNTTITVSPISKTPRPSGGGASAGGSKAAASSAAALTVSVGAVATVLASFFA